MNHLRVTEALNRPQKEPNMVIYGVFSQPYSQYSVRARADVRSRLFLAFKIKEVE